MKYDIIKLEAKALVDTGVLEDPTPRMNLETSEDIRREMAKVY